MATPLPLPMSRPPRDSGYITVPILPVVRVRPHRLQRQRNVYALLRSIPLSKALPVFPSSRMVRAAFIFCAAPPMIALLALPRHSTSVPWKPSGYPDPARKLIFPDLWRQLAAYSRPVGTPTVRPLRHKQRCRWGQQIASSHLLVTSGLMGRHSLSHINLLPQTKFGWWIVWMSCAHNKFRSIPFPFPKELPCGLQKHLLRGMTLRSHFGIKRVRLQPTVF